MSSIQMAVLLMVSGGVQPFNFTPTISADTLVPTCGPPQRIAGTRLGSIT